MDSTQGPHLMQRFNCSEKLEGSFSKLLDSAKGIKRLIVQQKEIEAHVEYQESMINALAVENSRLKEENGAAKKFLISNLPQNFGEEHDIGIKLFGEIDISPFINICSKRQPEKVSNETTIMKASEMCSQWQEKLKDPAWSPFKTVSTEGGTLKEIVDECDGELKKLKKDMGIPAYKAVIKALEEVNEHNPSGRYAVSKLWHLEQNREVTLQEVMECLLNNTAPKRKRTGFAFTETAGK